MISGQHKRNSGVQKKSSIRIIFRHLTCNQIWFTAGASDREPMNQMFVKPFFSYNWKSGAGIGANFKVSQNWGVKTTSVWFSPTLSAVTSFGNHKTQFVFGPRFNLVVPDGLKADIGVRAAVVFLFPKTITH